MTNTNIFPLKIGEEVREKSRKNPTRERERKKSTLVISRTFVNQNRSSDVVFESRGPASFHLFRASGTTPSLRHLTVTAAVPRPERSSLSDMLCERKPPFIGVAILCGLIALVYGVEAQEVGGCRYPGSPAHSRVVFSDDSLGSGTVATYSCERGFELLGPSRRVCENTVWLPEGIPFCGKRFFCIIRWEFSVSFGIRRRRSESFSGARNVSFGKLSTNRLVLNKMVFRDFYCSKKIQI
ncbi:hypothetical protein GWI33_023003 [Rhynchophorus ferrugineus]|uniref:Sushi domain-containing protein n=1 Tax=Rhynchophorus ferrugineus TaxID=354439 RepID=A0A834MM88_RHYFE|nr:hypothetical protein GWI33_023003 [Rhynchophorus ferrugineus]